MALQVAIGTFKKRAGSGSQDITGLPFQPKAVIFTSTGVIGSGFVTADAILSYGIDDGVTACCTASINTAGRLSSDPFTSNGVFTALMSVVVPMKAFPALIDCEGRITSMNADGFTFNWNLSTSPYTDMVVSYVAFGGSGVNAKVGQAQADNVGLQSITDVGFPPDVVHLMHGRGLQTLNTQGFGNVFYLNTGWMNSLGCQHSFNLHGQADPTVSYREQRTNRCIAPIDSVVTRDATYVSMDAGGFTIEWLTVETFGRLSYLALSGVDAAIGSFAQPGTTGRWRISDSGLTPTVVLFSTVGATASPSRQDDVKIAIGALTATQKVVDWTACPASSPLVTADYHSDDAAIIAADPATPGATSTLTMKAVPAALRADGFDLTFSPVAGVAIEVTYVALGTRTFVPDTPCVPSVSAPGDCPDQPTIGSIA